MAKCDKPYTVLEHAWTLLCQDDHKGAQPHADENAAETRGLS